MDDIFPRLRVMIADSLAVDQQEVTPESRLIDDLGADSLDFVDLTFAIEEEFGVKLRETDLNFLGGLDFSSPTVMKDGFITEQTLETLSPVLPALQRVADRTRVTPGQLLSLLTVDSVRLMIEHHMTSNT